MRDLLKKLAYKWCADHGDDTHFNWHEYKKEFSLFCPNCTDGMSFAKDVVKAAKERLSS